VGTPGGYSGSGWITQPRVTRARAQLVVDSSRHKKKKKRVVKIVFSWLSTFTNNWLYLEKPSSMDIISTSVTLCLVEDNCL
jgi:hypothetical protein